MERCALEVSAHTIMLAAAAMEYIAVHPVIIVLLEGVHLILMIKYQTNFLSSHR